jgi:hypothetical protein
MGRGNSSQKRKGAAAVAHKRPPAVVEGQGPAGKGKRSAGEKARPRPAGGPADGKTGDPVNRGGGSKEGAGKVTPAPTPQAERLPPALPIPIASFTF